MTTRRRFAGDGVGIHPQSVLDPATGRLLETLPAKVRVLSGQVQSVFHIQYSSWELEGDEIQKES
jgi:hypothetical protein